MKREKPKPNHVLRKIEGLNKFIGDDFYVFDVETKGKSARPESFVFGAIYGKDGFTKVLYSVEDFIKEFQDERYKGKVVFAHNAEYDNTTIFGNIFHIDNHAIFNGSRFITASNGNCHFADSFNIFPCSLQKLGEITGIAKGKLAQEYKTGKDVRITKKMVQYCIQDCRIVYEALKALYKEVGIRKITQASLTMSYYRTYFQPYNFWYNDRMVEYFRNSYFGGRTEAFQLGKVDAYVYDVNSMYPYAMRECEFPDLTKLIRLYNFSNKYKTIKGVRNGKLAEEKIFDGYNHDDLTDFMKNREGVVQCKVSHKDVKYPVLPTLINQKSNDSRLLFPVGIFSGWFNFNELRYAISIGYVEVLETYEIIFSYEKMNSPFKQYIDTLYNKRLESKDLFEKFRLKIFMNSLYGKFAQKQEPDQIYIKNREEGEGYEYIGRLIEEGKLIRMDAFSSYFSRKDCYAYVKPNEHKRPDWQIPLFASYITSHARIMLHQAIIKYEKYNPVYCDTDSIFFEHKPPIEDSNELGGWKLEEKVIREIWGQKMYVYEDKTGIHETVKGVRKFHHKSKLEKGKYYFKSMIKTKEGIRRNINAGDFVIKKKKLTFKNEKRIFDEQGNSKPIKL